jgi:hypothetical protein
MIATSNRAASNRTFWEVLPYVLPCKFCRTSLTTYYRQEPIPTKQADFAKWLYTVHNLVNKKLRDQGQSVDPDPPFSVVQERYTSLLAQGCSVTTFPGWEFLFSIADNHPDSSPSKPMPDAPDKPPASLPERNRCNMCSPAERKQQLKRFWAALPDVLPFEEWRSAWKAAAGPVSKPVKSRRDALRWLWKIRCHLDSELKELSQETFYGVCKEVATHRSGCSTSRNARTCRKLRNSHKSKTRKNRS